MPYGGFVVIMWPFSLQVEWGLKRIDQPRAKLVSFKSQIGMVYDT